MSKAVRGLLSRAALISLVVMLTTACGYYQPPQRPEVFVPDKVRGVTATFPTAQAVTLSWQVPGSDSVGRELKYISGYEVVLNKFAVSEQDGSFSSRFEKLAFIPDEHLTELKAKREAAIASGTISRKVKLEPEAYQFSYTYQQLEPGLIYRFQIIPQNLYGGALNAQTIQIDYSGINAQNQLPSVVIIRSQADREKNAGLSGDDLPSEFDEQVQAEEQSRALAF